MSNSLQDRILSHLKGGTYRPVKPRGLAKEINLTEGSEYHAFRDALRELVHQGRVVLGAGGNVVLPSAKTGGTHFVGTYRHNPRGFGFVVPTDPGSHEDLYIPEGENGGAITGDIVRAKVTNQEQRQGKTMYRGRITEIVSRTQKRFVGSVVKQHGQWLVLPDGNTLTAPILTPDAAGRHVKPGTKVVVELTHYPEAGQNAQGVITEILGQAGEKDVDLKSVIVQFNLPGEFPPETLDEARVAVDRFNGNQSAADRVDLSDQIICTIDPDDAKDFDDAISLSRNEAGQWELGVHIADVAFFIPSGSPLDEEAKARGNSCYFPGHVIPMLPEILSNGVCSLQADVGRFCKSAFITFDEAARPISTRFANTIIRSAARLRYREAQAILDRAEVIPHPDGPRNIEDYNPAVVELLHHMNALARKIQKRRLAAGQIVLELPEVELVLDENRKVVGTQEEDQSFTHTLIEMFMVEANEAVARLLDSIDVPFLRRIHPDPDLDDSSRLRNFVQATGYQLPKELDRKAIQQLLNSVKGKPESFAINLSVLKSLSRAEYSPRNVGHYALASKQYCHFTSPIRRYADLTVHRLLDQYLRSSDHAGKHRKPHLEDVPSFDALIELGKRLSFTERRADDAERELRQIKLLELLQHQVGEDFAGVITGITSFGIFIQLTKYLIDGLVRYEDLMDDWWDVDERAGQVRGQRSGRVIGIGDPVTARIARVDPPRRQLDLIIAELKPRPGRPAAWRLEKREPEKPRGKKHKPKSFKTRQPHPGQRRRGRR